MKKALGLMIVVICLLLSACTQTAETEGYEHTSFVSDVPQEDCFVCGDHEADRSVPYWGEDNVGIINLNTFQILYLEINRYGDRGELLQTPAGVMLHGGLSGENTWVNSMADPDRGYAIVHITGEQQAIDQETVQSRLCQSCLDSINSLWFDDQRPLAYGVLNFAEETLRPVMECYPWFTFGNYGISTEFESNGDIDIIVFYCPPRYEEIKNGN